MIDHNVIMHTTHGTQSIYVLFESVCVFSAHLHYPGCSHTHCDTAVLRRRNHRTFHATFVFFKHLVHLLPIWNHNTLIVGKLLYVPLQSVPVYVCFTCAEAHNVLVYRS